VVPAAGGHRRDVVRRGAWRGAERWWRTRSRTGRRSAPRGPTRRRCSRSTRRRAAGATEIVSVHLSARPERHLRVGPARRQGEAPGVKVTVVDTRQVAFAPGTPRWRGRRGRPTAAPAARRPRPPRAARRRQARRCSTSTRWSTCAAAAGSAPRPPPRRCAGGEAAAADRGRQDRVAREGAHRGKALARLEELAVEAAGDQPGRRLRRAPGQPRPGRQLAERLAERLAANLGGREVWCGELGAVLGAHVGPGMVAVCVAPPPARSVRCLASLHAHRRSRAPSTRKPSPAGSRC
jgi:hypothetical protein